MSDLMSDMMGDIDEELCSVPCSSEEAKYDLPVTVQLYLVDR